MPKYFTDKQERMYEHVKDSTGSKQIAAATVNKYRSKHGLTKKKKHGKGDDIDAIASRTTVGKSYDVETQPMARGKDMPRVAGTTQPSTPRKVQKPPKSSATKLNTGGKSMSAKQFSQLFKSYTGDEIEEEEVAKAAECSDDESSDEMSKSETDDEASAEVVKAEGEEEGEEAFPCPNCASDITVSDVQKAMESGAVHRKGVGGSPKGKQKHGEKKPARTAVTEMHGGGTGHGGAPGGNKTPVRGATGVARQPNPGETGSYKKSAQPFRTPLIEMAENDGPAGDKAMAAEIARMHGVNVDDIG